MTPNIDTLNAIARNVIAALVLIGCWLLLSDANVANDETAKAAVFIVLTFYFVDAARTAASAATERVLTAARRPPAG